MPRTVTLVGDGTTPITFTHTPSGKTVVVPVTVVSPGAVDHLTADPPSVAGNIGDDVVLTPTAFDVDDLEVTGETFTFAMASGTGDVATLTPAGDNLSCTVTIAGAGTDQVQITDGGVELLIDVVGTDPDAGGGGAPPADPTSVSEFFFRATLAEQAPSALGSAALPPMGAGVATPNSFDWRSLSPTAGSASSNANLHMAGTTGTQCGCFNAFVSDPMAAQTIASGTWTVKVGLYNEGQATGDGMKAAPSVYVFRPSDSSIVGYLRDDATGIGSEDGSWSTGGDVFTFTASSLDVLDGDLLVCEMWLIGTTGTTNGSVFRHMLYDAATAITAGSDISGGCAGSISPPAAITCGPADLGIIRVGPTGFSVSTGALPSVVVTNDTEFRSMMFSDGTLWDASQTSLKGGLTTNSTHPLDHSTMRNVDLLSVDESIQFTDRDGITRNTLKIEIKPGPSAPISSANDNYIGESITPEAGYALPAGRTYKNWYARRLFRFKPGFLTWPPNQTQSNAISADLTVASATSSTITVTGAGWTTDQFVNSMVRRNTTGNDQHYRIITSNTSDTLTLGGINPGTDAAWDTTPSTSDTFKIYGYNGTQSGAYKMGPHPLADTRVDFEISGGQNFGSDYMTSNTGTTHIVEPDTNYIIGAMSDLMPGWNTGGDVWEICRAQRSDDVTIEQATYIGKVTDTHLVQVSDVTQTLLDGFLAPRIIGFNITGKNFNCQLGSTDAIPQVNVSDTEFASLDSPTFEWPSQIQVADRI